MVLWIVRYTNLIRLKYSKRPLRPTRRPNITSGQAELYEQYIRNALESEGYSSSYINYKIQQARHNGYRTLF